MKPFPFLIILGLAGLFAGILCGRWSGGRLGTTPEVSSASQNASGREPGSISRRLATAPAEKRDLKSLLRWWLLDRSGGADRLAQLERMDAPAIRSLITDLAAAQVEPGLAGSVPMTAMLEAAAGELFRREGEKALQWADAFDPAGGRKAILTAMICAAVAESPELAKPWFDRYLSEFGRNIRIIGAAIKGATARGAEDLVKLKEIYGRELQSNIPNGPLPEDFNFRLFMDHFSPGEPASRTTMQRWAAKDPEAAWKAVKEFSSNPESDGSSYFGALFVGMAVGGKEKEAIRWLMPKLDELPQEFRHRALDSLFSDSWNTRAAVADIMAEIPREDDRIAVADGLLNPVSSGPAGLDALRALGNEDAQVKALLVSANGWSESIKSPPDARTRETLLYYSTLMDELGLSPGSRAKFDAWFPQVR